MKAIFVILTAATVFSSVTTTASSRLWEVQISKNVEPEKCESIIENIKSLLTTTSAKLSPYGHAATGAVIHLPASWRHAPCTLPTAPGPQPSRPHLLVESTPLTRPTGAQFAGCGVAGRALTLPLSVLLEKNLTRATEEEFFAGFVSNTFGLFENRGSENSSQFPREFSIGKQTFQNIGCPDGGNFCSAEEYNPDAPTQQNLLCHGRSWTQILANQSSESPSTNITSENDLSENDLSENLFTENNLPSLEFSYRLSEERMVFLVLDRSAKMAELNRWNNLHNALHRIISDLPSGTKIGIVTFDSGAKVNLEPTQITELNRAGIHGKIPGRIGAPGPACLSCGLNTAADMIRTAAGGAAGTVIVVTGEENEKLNFDKEILEDMNVYTVGYSGLQLAAPASNPENIFVLGESEEGVDVLASTFYQILQREELIDARFQFYSHALTASASDRVGGKFVVEEGLRSNLHVVASTSLKEDIENFELVSPSGKQFQFPVVEKGIIHFQFPGRAEPGVWSYSIKTVTAVSAETISVTVSASAEAETPETSAALEVWTAGENPTVIYARVRLGSLPVFNASITASIKGPGAGNLALKLSDGGGGYPDLSPGDGIYSAYFTGVSAQPGFYSLSVQASDGSGAARVTETSSGFRIPTPSFTRYARASFHVARGAEYLIRDGIPQMDDIFPPARITNLRVKNYLSDSLEAGLSWTAPGGDFNVGSAAEYEIRCYTNRAALSQANFSVTGIPVPVVPTPGAAGSAQEANITVPWPNEVFYYAIVAIDASGNRGEVSNLVPVYVDEVPPAPDTSSANAPLRSAPIFQHNDDNIIYIVSGSLTGLALIALCLGIAFICRTKRKEVMDKSDSLDYIKELGPSSLLPATKYGYTSETGTYSPSAATYSTIIGPYSTSTTAGGPYSTSTGPYSTSTGPYPSETEAFSHETGHYSPEAAAAGSGTSYSHESYRVGGGNYSPPRTSPSEYSTDSVFILGSKAPMYNTTYQNLPPPASSSREQNSESEFSEASSGSRWESTRMTAEAVWDSATQHNTWNSTAAQYPGGDHSAAAGYSVSVTSEKKRRRKESFV